MYSALVVPLVLALMGLISVIGITHATNESLNPSDYQAGYQYGTNEWNQSQTPEHINESHHFECPLSQPFWHSNFCKGYDAALKYQNSDN
jgi:hypothetical protein